MASRHLTGRATKIMIELKDDDGKLKDIHVPSSFFSGDIDLVRARIHGLVDEVIGSYEHMEGVRDKDIQRKDIKKVHPENGKPFVWSPRPGK